MQTPPRRDQEMNLIMIHPSLCALPQHKSRHQVARHQVARQRVAKRRHACRPAWPQNLMALRIPQTSTSLYRSTLPSSEVSPSTVTSISRTQRAPRRGFLPPVQVPASQACHIIVLAPTPIHSCSTTLLRRVWTWTLACHRYPPRRIRM